MKGSSTYSVVASGDIKLGYDLANVQDAFSSLFKIRLDQAKGFVGVKRTIKKDLDLETARSFVERLDSIGLDVTLKEHLPDLSSGTPAFSLEPMGQGSSFTTPKFVCPKCDLEQSKSQQCTGCGVFFDKVNKSRETQLEQPPIQSDKPSKVKAEVQEKSNNTGDSTSAYSFIAIGVVAGVALMGAFLWKMIAVSFGYELGLVAWFIGGAVGFIAAAFGARGEAFGALCGALTLVAILGGKYMTIESFQSDLTKTFSSFSAEETEVLREAYQEELDAAYSYSEDIVNERSLRQFMVNYGYSDASEIEQVTAEEVAFFKSSSEQRLKNILYQKPTFEQWLESTLKLGLEGYSTVDLMKEDFGMMDLVFLSLGVATAFRLGSGNRRF